MITEAQLKHWEEIEARSTEGPWREDIGNCEVECKHRNVVVAFDQTYARPTNEQCDCMKSSCDSDQANDDARFIAHAKNTYLPLIQECRRLREVIEHNLKEQLYCERTQGKKILDLREALKFYAINDIHSVNFDFTDNGKRAREALGVDT